MPPVISGWSQSGRLITANPNAAVTLQVEFPIPDTYTLSFGIIKPARQAAAPVNRNYRPKAFITWSVHGNQIEREITISQGTSISGRGEGVIVRAFDDLQGLSGLAPTGIPYILSITCSKGVRASGQYPIFQPKNVENPVGTAVVDDGSVTVGNGTAAMWTIPLGAVAVWANIFKAAAATSDIYYRFIDPEGNIINNAMIDITGEWVPIPTRSNRIQVFNSSGLDITASVLFGIDG